MKKRVVSAVLCMAMLATMFTGCGSSADTDSTADKKTDTAATNDAAAESETKTDDAAADDGDVVTISYACWDSNQANLLETVAEEFEAENPNIKIDIQVNGWSDYWTALEAAGTGGSLPDTFWMHSNNILKLRTLKCAYAP